MEQADISPQQALDLLAQAASAFRGTLAEHQTLQNAVVVLNELVNPKEETSPKKK